MVPHNFDNKSQSPVTMTTALSPLAQHRTKAIDEEMQLQGKKI